MSAIKHPTYRVYAITPQAVKEDLEKNIYNNAQSYRRAHKTKETPPVGDLFKDPECEVRLEKTDFDFGHNYKLKRIFDICQRKETPLFYDKVE